MTFLYRLSPGACPKSYGMHVAAMADIPSEVICRAEEMSSQFENVIFQRMNKQRQKKEKLFENILKICNNPLSNLSALLSVWRECQTLAK
jgi:DNA mismatch repair protein MSH6